MSWPTALPEPIAVRARGAMADALTNPMLCGAAASGWARLLERPTAVAPHSGPPQRSSLRSWAAWRDSNGHRGLLAVDRHLLAGVVGRLAGTSGRAVGPCPLSPAEEGLFAYLALQWLQLVPGCTLEWVHGGDPAWPLLATPRRAGIGWSVEIGDQRGSAVWWLPQPLEPCEGGPVENAQRTPIPLTVSATAQLSPHTALAPGDRLPCARPQLRHARGPMFSVRAVTEGLRLMALESALSPSTLESLPVALTLELGSIVLDAGVVAALQAGDLLPVAVADPPIVTVKAGDQAVAMGVLVEDAGGIAVQLTRVLISR
jgi:type III secretion protein Q